MLVDANALFLPIRTGFPLEAEVVRIQPGSTVGVPSSVLAELDRLVLRRTPDAAAARALAARYPVVRAPGRGDDAVLLCARRSGAWVVTADRALRERLVAEGVTVLAPRDRHRLERFPGVPRARPPSLGRPRRSR